MRRFTIMVGQAINDNWPQEDAGKRIVIQMDNATPHVKNDNPEWLAAKANWRFDIDLICQPAQLPDCNILDLGLWNSLQAAQ